MMPLEFPWYRGNQGSKHPSTFSNEGLAGFAQKGRIAQKVGLLHKKSSDRFGPLNLWEFNIASQGLTAYALSTHPRASHSGH